MTIESCFAKLAQNVKEQVEKFQLGSDDYPVFDWTAFEPYVLRHSKTGSRVISPDTASQVSDFDWVIQVEKLKEFLCLLSLQEDWVLEGPLDFDDPELFDNVDFFSLRKQNMNLIVVRTNDFYDKFVLATDVATELKLETRQKRVCLFKAILYQKFEPLEECERKHRYD